MSATRRSKGVRAVRLAVGPLALAAVAGLGAVACGVPAEEEAHRAPVDDVPEELLRPPTTLPPTTTTSAPARFEVVLYFVGPDERLVAVERVLAAAASLEDLVSLLRQPPDDDAGGATRSALAAAEPVVRSVVLERGVALVDLTAAFQELEPTDQVLGIAQIVYTVTGQSGVGRAAFRFEGEPIGVPTGDGLFTTEPVAREDYRSLVVD